MVQESYARHSSFRVAPLDDDYNNRWLEWSLQCTRNKQCHGRLGSPKHGSYSQSLDRRYHSDLIIDGASRKKVVASRAWKITECSFLFKISFLEGCVGRGQWRGDEAVLRVALQMFACQDFAKIVHLDSVDCGLIRSKSKQMTCGQHDTNWYSHKVSRQSLL